MKAQQENAVTIIGAGLTGSLLATLLAQRGFLVNVYERAGDPRTSSAARGRSINLALAARGIKALKLAGIDKALAPKLCPMPGRMLHDLNGESEFRRYGAHAHEINYSVERTPLNKLLIDAAERAGAKFNFQQVCLGYDVDMHTLRMRDERGVELSYKLRCERIFAADGAGSLIRRALVKQQELSASETLLDHGYKEITIAAADDPSTALEAEALHIWPRGGYMLIALPNPAGDFTATLFMKNEGAVSFESLTEKSAVHAFFASEFPDVLKQVPDLVEQFLQNPVGVMGTVRCERYHFADKCLLVGDAAHAIVPFHGQGMNAGFEDCVELLAIIDKCDNWADVFARFSETRVADANAIADMALENYIEMRDSVRDPRFALKKALGFELEHRCPKHFVPRYSMVMFHPEIRYSTAQSRGDIQSKLLDEFTADRQSLEQIDIDDCIDRLKQALPALD